VIVIGFSCQSDLGGVVRMQPTLSFQC